MNKDNLNTLVTVPYKTVMNDAIALNAPIKYDSELEQLRKENKRLQEKVEGYMLKECMSRVESLAYSASKETVKSYLDGGNPIMVLIECFRYSNGEYRKKQVVIEAFQLGVDFMPDWFMDQVSANKIILKNCGLPFIKEYAKSHMFCLINTLEGEMRGDYGDYIIKGVKGEIYPCKPDIFEMTYELVFDEEDN